MLPAEIYPSFMKRINAFIYRFIWTSKWQRISRLKLLCSVEMGGAKMLHLSISELALRWK